MNDKPPHEGKKRSDLEKGAEAERHSTRVGVLGFHIRKRRTAGATSARAADDETMRPTTADTLEERNKPCQEEKTGVAAESGPGDTADTTASGPALEHTTNLDTDYPVHLYNDYDSGLPSRSSLPGPVLELGRMSEILRVLLVCSPSVPYLGYLLSFWINPKLASHRKYGSVS